MTDQEVQKLKIGDFLTWTDEDENYIEVGRIMGLEHFDKNHDPAYRGKLSGAKVLVFPRWRSSDSFKNENIVTLCLYDLKFATFSTEMEINVWAHAAVDYRDDLARTLEKVKRLILHPVVQKHVLPMSAVKFDYRRNPPKPNCSWNWLWSKAKSVGLWKPSKIKKEQEK